MAEDAPSQPLSIEEARLFADLAIRYGELDLREQELDHRRKIEERSWRTQVSPSTTAIIAGMLSLITGGITASASGCWTRQIEQDRAARELQLKTREQQFQIILAATTNRTPEEAAKNLLFFVDIGYLTDSAG